MSWFRLKYVNISEEALVPCLILAFMFIQLLDSTRKLICTSLSILLDHLLEIAATEYLFLKSPVMETGQGQAPTKT